MTGGGPAVPSRPRGPDTSPGFLLWRVTLRWQRDVAAALKPHGLTHVQFVLLAAVCWLGDHPPVPGSRTRRAAAAREDADPVHRPSQAEVAAHAGADVMMTSSVLRALEVRGLVIRSPDPRDARVRRLAVTPEGRRLAQETIAVVEAADAAFFAAAGSQEQVLAVLRSLAGEGAAT